MRLLERESTGSALDNHVESISLTTFSRNDTNIWDSCPPQLFLPVIKAACLAMSGRKFEPLINIDFGGPHGQLLPTLNMVAVMMSNKGQFIGLRFTYVDGTSIFYGNELGSIKTYYIDGPGGERIERVKVEFPRNDPNRIESLKVMNAPGTTNPSIEGKLA